MRMESVLLRQFRNYEESFIKWHPELNIIFGSNAQGKTNLLEAIAYLSLGASFRGGKDPEMIGWEKPFFYIEGHLTGKKGLQKLSVGMDEKKRKLWRLEGQPKKRFQEIAGTWHTVVFSPEDLWLVKSGPSVRREFLNQQMVQLYPEYTMLLCQYHQALLQRNEMLRQCKNRVPHEELLLAWDESLVKPGAAIIKKRKSMIDRLLPLASELHGKITEKNESLRLEYRSILPAQDIVTMEKEDIEQAFLELLAKERKEEIMRGMTLIGPHRDDVFISINGEAARQFGSQGQQRTAALSLKLSQVELVWQEIGEYPALLLDDVLSELDENRRQQLLCLMQGKTQTFITATEARFSLPQGNRYYVDNGTVRLM